MANCIDGITQLPHRLYDAIRPLILKTNYYLGRYQSAVWLFGDGRSGTTFVADLINYNRRYREIFEPFHPKFVKAMTGFPLHQYIRPGSENIKMTKVATDVFSGRLVDNFTDSSSTRLFYNDLLVKDIFANLLAYWALTQLGSFNIRPVLLIRNPFAVAVSKYKKKDWEWMTDPRDFLKQEHLVEDFLQPFVDNINNVSDDFIERQIMIWSIIHYVPFRQFHQNKLHVLFYEKLLQNPEEELRDLFSYLELPASITDMHDILGKFSVPSRVAGADSSIVRGESPIESWRSKVTDMQLQNGYEILKTFGLYQIYGHSSVPQVSVKDLLQKG